MGFLVEDGTGLELANAYIAVQFFKDHHADRGRDVTAITDSVIQTTIVRATDYIDKRFGRKFRGVRTSKRQGLEWPRLDAFDNDDFILNEVDQIPRQLEKATAEYALRAFIYGELAPDPLRPVPNQDLSGPAFVAATTGTVSGVVRSFTDRVEGAVTQSKEFATMAELQVQLRDKAILSFLVSGVSIPEYPEADLWLEELMAPPQLNRIIRTG